MAGFLDAKRIILRPMTRTDLPEPRAQLEERESYVLTGSVYPMTEEGRQVEGFFSEGRCSVFVIMRSVEDEYRASHGR